MKKTFIILFTLLVCCSCGTPKVATQIVRESSVDTVYLSNIQYDSIYVYQERLQDRSKDTVYLKDVSVEYRYKLLRDTVRVIQRDSIPYEVTIVETKEITRPLTWFDHLSRAITLLFLAIAIAKAFVRKKVKPSPSLSSNLCNKSRNLFLNILKFFK